jgi:hypothetical protein
MFACVYCIKAGSENFEEYVKNLYGNKWVVLFWFACRENSCQVWTVYLIHAIITAMV